jgi:hypothetical protein
MNNDMEILTLGLTEAWSMFKIMNNGDESYRKVRFGITIKFDINDYIKGRIMTKPKIGKALIRGKTYKLEEFETELESRERVIKQWLMVNYKEEDSMPKPRMEGLY